MSLKGQTNQIMRSDKILLQPIDFSQFANQMEKMLKGLEEKIQIKGQIINKIIKEKNEIFSKIKNFLIENKDIILVHHNKLSLLFQNENNNIKKETIENVINKRSRVCNDPKNINYRNNAKTSLNYYTFQEEFGIYKIDKIKQSGNWIYNSTPSKNDSYFDINSISKKIYKSISKLKSPDLNILFSKEKIGDAFHPKNIRNFHHKTFITSNFQDKNEKSDGMVKNPLIFSPISNNASNKIFSSASPLDLKLPKNLDRNESDQKNLRDHIKEYREKLSYYINSNFKPEPKILIDQDKSLKHETHHKIREELSKMHSIQKSYFKLIDMYQKRERIFCSDISQAKNEMKIYKSENESAHDSVSILGKKMQDIIQFFSKCDVKIKDFENRFKNALPLIKVILKKLLESKNKCQILESKLLIFEQNECLLKLEKVRNDARGKIKLWTEDKSTSISNIYFNSKMNKFSNFSPLNIKDLTSNFKNLHYDYNLKNESMLCFQNIESLTLRDKVKINNYILSEQSINYEANQKEIIMNEKITYLEKQIKNNELKWNEFSLKINKEKEELIYKYESIINNENQRMSQIINQITQMNNEIQNEISRNIENSGKVILYDACLKELSEKLINLKINDRYKEMSLLIDEINKFKNENILCSFKQIEENMEKILSEYKDLIIERDNLKLIVENNNRDFSIEKLLQDFLFIQNNLQFENNEYFEENINNPLKAKRFGLVQLKDKFNQSNNFNEENSINQIHLNEQRKINNECSISDNKTFQLSKQDISKTNSIPCSRTEQNFDSSRIFNLLKLNFFSIFKGNLQKKLKLNSSIHNINILNLIQSCKPKITRIESNNKFEIKECENHFNFSELSKINIIGTNTFHEYLESIKFLVQSIYDSDEYLKIFEQQIINKNISNICLIVARDFLKLKVNNELLLQNKKSDIIPNKNINKRKSKFNEDQKARNCTSGIDHLKTLEEISKKRLSQSPLSNTLSKRSLNKISRNSFNTSSKLIKTNTSKIRNLKKERLGSLNFHFKRNNNTCITYEVNKEKKRTHRSSKNLKLKEVISKLSEEVNNMRATLFETKMNHDFENHRNL